MLHSEEVVRHSATEYGSIYQLLKARAARNAGAIAILAPGRRSLSYGGLLRHVEKTTNDLALLGLGRTDRVAIVLPNGPEMAVSFLAVASVACCAPLNPLYRAEEFESSIRDFDAKALIVASGIDSPARQVARKRGISVVELMPAIQAEAGIFTLSEAGPVSTEIGFAGPADTALVLHTSGTTSRPKVVPLTQANICASALNTVRALALTDKDCCLNVMPLFHIHGLIGGLLASIAAGGRIVCTPGFDSSEFFGWLDAFEPTWYTAVPTMHQGVLAGAADHPAIIARRPLRLIRSCSAPLPAQLMEELENAFRTQVIEAYGMTEGAHQITSNPLAPRVRKANSVGVPAGPEVGIMDERGELLSVGQVGEVVIRGSNVTPGYDGNARANQDSFTNGWFRTGDQGRIDADGYLFLTGRIKEIINRGGEKVSPREVDDVLTRHPGVAQAVTFAVPHPTLGEDVAAAVVLRPGAQATPREIRDFAGARLAEFKTPRQVLVVDTIPKGPTGKLQRIGLADKLADLLAATRQASYQSARTPVEKQIVEIWRKRLNIENISTGDDFFALGGDSLSTTAMIVEVEGRFKTTLPIEAFLKSPTVQTLSELCQPGDPASRSDTPSEVAHSRPITDSMLIGFRNRILQLLALYAPGYKTTRVWLHRMRGVSIGENVSIGLSALIETAYPRLVSIGNNVTIGVRAVIIAHFRDSTAESRMIDRATVRIEDDVYIGPGVIVLPNVTIGHGAVVSAGSVVNRSVPPLTLVQGNPARPIARCGVSLGGGVPYEQFLRHLTPIGDQE